MELPGRILVIGCGSVSQCTLPLLLKELDVAPSSITVLDMVDNRARIADVLAAGVRYEIGRITPENLDAELSRHLGPGDVCIDLAWNIDTCTILDWCRVARRPLRQHLDRAVGSVRGRPPRPTRSSARCTCGTWRCAA